ncbi:MAG: hypothetical protein ACHQM6_00130 [Candidatus Kapaibacterium sp.]
MSESDSKKKVTRAIYIAVSLLFLILLIGSEFFWRYDTKLDITISTSLRDAALNQRKLVIHELSDSPVDTTRREFKNILHGKTDVAIALEGSRDSIHLSFTGKYISEARPMHISSDSSTQIVLIPNTLQGLPTGSNSIIYLRNDSLKLLEFPAFIGDVDHDGNEEVNIPEEGGWMRLNTATGQWIPAVLKR